MRAAKVMTFAEFLEIAEKNTMLIYPDENDEARDKNQLGIIQGWNWTPVEFTDKAEHYLLANL